MASLDLESLRPLQDQLANHEIYGAIGTLEDLRVFMKHHVFSVWDFMSLIKYLQRSIAPVQVPWMPTSDPSLRYFINQLVLEEESDAIPIAGEGTRFASHFEFYCRAMQEVGADADMPQRFLTLVAEQGIDKALYSDPVPLPARYFSETTFCFIREDKPHMVAAALALGRENLIPSMFRRLLERMGIGPEQAPAFHAYLERHIHLDQDFHGPLSMRLLETLCGDDPKRIEEAETAAEEALCARIRFWDGVLEAIRTK
ncbi:DUF3050 domain-containing protein [Imhoffiella purpurea]|uniref:Putative truncated transposase n=1 Tax=Imhoffiella purpurea TaxID=1249627 RepID=W9VGR2_9GAMM|nr:DUF3050 domain-containing protein [Imhoffiella purpurea]EXJ16206.1 putative truncated transposase [Imhoffiella purpurea]